MLILSGLVAVPLVSNATTPVVTSLAPSSITETGDRLVVLSGSALSGDNLRVLVGGVEATVVSASETEITFEAPSRYDAAFGTSSSLSHSVTVERTGGTSDDTVALSYIGITAVPTVDAVTPATGTASGGTAITITGSNFLPGRTSVFIGGVPATSVSVSSATSLSAVTPAPASSDTVSTRVVVRVAGDSADLESTEDITFEYTVDEALETYVPEPPCEAAPPARAVANSGNLFLGGYFIELGISPLGNFGTSGSKPTGIFGTIGSSGVGMSVDYDGFGCGQSKAIDFFLPGSPEERFAVGAKVGASNAEFIGISQLAGIETSSGVGTVSASDTTITNLSTGTLLRAKVVSILKTSTGENWIEVTQEISFEVDAMYFTNEVTLKNLTSGTLDSARYMRSFDPDNTQFQGGSFVTENTILAQYPTDSYTAVRAQVTSGNLASDPIYQLYGTRAPIIFYSNDEKSRAGAFGFKNSNPYTSSAYDSAPAKNFTVNADQAITIALEYGPLTANQAITKTYVTSLDLRDFNELAAELELGASSAGSGFSVSPRAQTISGSPGESKTTTPLRTSGLTGTITYEVTSGTLPAGLTLNSATGVVSGTPTGTGTGSITVTATGSTGGVASAVINFSIKNSQTALTLTSTQGTVGTGLTLATSGGSGTGMVSYSVSNGTASGCSVSSGILTASSAGTCLVTATKAADGDFLAVSTSVTTVTFTAKPGAPTITAVTAGTQSLSVAFTPPASDGGAPITNYGYALDGGTVVVFSPAQTTSPLVISGLTAGVEYSVRIVAINAAGQSNLSAALTGTPNAPASAASIPVPTPTPTAPAPTPTARPTPQPTPQPTLINLLTPPAPPALPAPVTGPIALLVPVEPVPNVVFGSTNPIPQFISDILAKPLAYVLSVLSGSPELPALAPTESIAYENGSPVEIQLVKTDSENGYVLRGDGWQVALEATDSSGSPLRLDDSGNIILNTDRFVQFSGSGFAPGSIVRVWLFSEPTELSDLLADASGSFTGQAQLPEGIPVGEHTVQLNGLTQDGQLRSVSLGVLVQPDPVIAPAAFDLTGLINLLWIMAAGVLSVFFFILWRRRKKKEEEGEIPSSLVGDDNLIFASEGFEPIPQMPNDSRRKIGPAAPPNRKRFTFKPKNT
jgi:hypothetical protein